MDELAFGGISVDVPRYLNLNSQLYRSRLLASPLIFLNIKPLFFDLIL